jgi:hypothetical protein
MPGFQGPNQGLLINQLLPRGIDDHRSLGKLGYGLRIQNIVGTATPGSVEGQDIAVWQHGVEPESSPRALRHGAPIRPMPRIPSLFPLTCIPSISLSCMLGVALMLFVLREAVTDAMWPKLEKLVLVSFWGLNIGLAMMVTLSLFPGVIMQVYDVINHGYWHARRLAYTATPLARTLEWMRMPGDLVFIFAGAIPLAIAVVLGYLSLWKRHPAAKRRPRLP